MHHTSHQATRENVQTLEKGAVYFFYRPKIGAEHPKSLADVQRFYMVMKPDAPGWYRRAVIGHKHLPDPSVSGHRRFWGFIDMTAKDPRKIIDDLKGNVHRTKTRGTEHQPAARPVGEGVYRIVKHRDEEEHTHLVYALAEPRREGQVQEALYVEPDASYILSVRNPLTPSKAQAGLSAQEEVRFPKDVQERFGEHKFIDADPPHLLDFAGVEFVMISASSNVQEELGVRLHPDSESAAYAEILKDLKAEGFSGKLEPMFGGKWE